VSHFSIWPAFGFRENPYSNKNLLADETGDALLVGRGAEVAETQRKIAGAGIHASVEGDAGVGKSSMIAVAAFRMMKESLSARDGTLFVPVRRFFQAEESADAVEEEVYREVAQTLIANVEAFRTAGHAIPNIGDLDKWLNLALYRSGSGNVGFAGLGYGTQPTAAEGFSQSGFPDAVRRELERCFPGPGAGAIICVLDNLELLQTSAKARETLEQLRDRIFTIEGLRWVLCGSRGIVSRARSQRLSGVFSAPLVLGPLPDRESIELISRRIEYYGGAGACPPVTPIGFEFLYRALHSNLRDALAYAQQFSDWLYEQYVITKDSLPSETEREDLLEVWLTDQADAAHSESRVQPRIWQFFDDLAQRGGRCGASEWERYDFSTQQQLGTSVTSLANANLVVREIDPENATRSIATITPQGWLVYFHRNRYHLPTR
jgi:hypothetical protein